MVAMHVPVGEPPPELPPEPAPVARPPPPPARPPAPPPEAGPAPAPAPAAYLSQREAVDTAFRLARQRGLEVDRVKSARLDEAGRWHVELRGHGDRATLLLDARDGRMLKGRFRAQGR